MTAWLHAREWIPFRYQPFSLATLLALWMLFSGTDYQSKSSRKAPVGVCCADVQVTQESREAEGIQATVAEEEQAVGVQTAETAALKGKPDLGCTHDASTRWADE